MTDQLLVAVTEAVSDAIVVADLEGRIVRWTGGAERIFGWTAAEAEGMPLKTIVPDQLREAHVEGFAAVVAGGPESLFGACVEVQGLHRDGTVFPIELTLGRGDGFFVGVIRDTTERQRQADELDRSLAELDQFAGVVSHDLSAPLQIVTGYLDLLRRRHGDALDEEARSFVDAAHTAATDMRGLIAALLQYARLGHDATELGPVDLGPLVADVVTTLQEQIAEREIAVELGPLPVVLGERTLLRQIVQNLLANALRHAHSRVRIEAPTLKDGGCSLVIGDDGDGIDEALRAKVLEMFVAGQGGRTGLGLAIVRRAVDRLGGTVAIGDSPLGGAEITVTLPGAPS